MFNVCRLQLKCDGTRWRKEGKWRGNWRMEWVASTLQTASEHGVSSTTTADAHVSAASSRLNWRPLPDLNGLVCFAERWNLVSAHVPSHFKRSLPAWSGPSYGATEHALRFSLIFNVLRLEKYWLQRSRCFPCIVIYSMKCSYMQSILFHC